MEDAGPLAHPVRPRLYHEINNFYTATVYEKGAEVVRMLKALLGPGYGAIPNIEALARLGYQVSPNAKVNLGLGRPRAEA